jgi:hypothetical protein
MKTFRAWFAPLILVGSVIVIAWGCAAWNPSGSTRTWMAEAYGAKAFNQVEELRYTFNVQLPDRVATRSWSWEPKKDRVTFTTPGESGVTTYNRATLGTHPTDQLKKIDALFINDNYWLLFPLRIVWDDSVSIREDPAPASLPIGTGQARHMVVTFPPQGGYTPGDVYELFYDSSGRIVQWIYRKGGDATPTRITTWEDYRQLGPLTLALDHQAASGGFRVWFTDVAVRVSGKPDWLTAK